MPVKKGEMTFLNHNGVDVETEEDVHEARWLVVGYAEKWRLHQSACRQYRGSLYVD
jgi:uncharacterized DUF497 family protein